MHGDLGSANRQNDETLLAKATEKRIERTDKVIDLVIGQVSEKAMICVIRVSYWANEKQVDWGVSKYNLIELQTKHEPASELKFRFCTDDGLCACVIKSANPQQ